MASVKLFNQGARIISGVDNGTNYAFPPKKSMEFSVEEGNKLRRLYSNELVSMDDVTRSFAAQPSINAPKKEAKKEVKEEEPAVEEDKAAENPLIPPAPVVIAQPVKHTGRGKK